MCEAYVRLICAQSNSRRLTYFFHCFATSSLQCPRGPPREPAGGPPGAPKSPRRKHISNIFFFEPPPGGPPEDAPEAPGNQPHTTPHIYCTLENRGQEPGARSQPHITKIINNEK